MNDTADFVFITKPETTARSSRSVLAAYEEEPP